MDGTLLHMEPEKYQNLAIWIISLFLVAFGFRYAKDLISFVLMKLYDLFIQQNSSLS